MLKYRIDVFAELKEHGYTSYILSKDKIFGGGTLQNIRLGNPPRPDTLNTLCKLLDCQPGDILEYVPDDTE